MKMLHGLESFGCMEASRCEQDKIMERIEELYSELYGSDQTVTIQAGTKKEVRPIMAWKGKQR